MVVETVAGSLLVFLALVAVGGGLTVTVRLRHREALERALLGQSDQKRRGLEDLR